MGVSSPVKEQLKNLRRVRNLLLTDIELNEVKLKELEKKILEYSNKITKEQNEIKQFQYSLSKVELQIKARNIISLENNKKREEKNYDMKFNYNENLKNNLFAIENKIDELRLYKTLKETEKAMKKTDLISTSATLAENASLLLKEKEKQERILGELKTTGELISEDKRTPDDILKEILGDKKNSENGGFY